MVDNSEMLELRAKAQAWIDSLQIGGMSENAAVAAIHLALVERALVAGGVEKTAKWLRGMAEMVEMAGADLLALLREEGH